MLIRASAPHHELRDTSIGRTLKRRRTNFRTCSDLKETPRQLLKDLAPIYALNVSRSLPWTSSRKRPKKYCKNRRSHARAVRMPNCQSRQPIENTFLSRYFRDQHHAREKQIDITAPAYPQQGGSLRQQPQSDKRGCTGHCPHSFGHSEGARDDPCSGKPSDTPRSSSPARPARYSAATRWARGERPALVLSAVFCVSGIANK